MNDDETTPGERLVTSCFVCGAGPVLVIADERTHVDVACAACGVTFRAVRS